MSDLEWTTKKPTKPGWYWFRRVLRDTVGEAECVRLREAFPSELQDDRLYMRNLPQDTRRVDWMNLVILGSDIMIIILRRLKRWLANGPDRWNRQPNHHRHYRSRFSRLVTGWNVCLKSLNSNRSFAQRISSCPTSSGSAPPGTLFDRNYDLGAEHLCKCLYRQKRIPLRAIVD